MMTSAEKNLRLLGHELGNVFYNLRSDLALLSSIRSNQNTTRTSKLLRRLESQVESGSAMLNILSIPERFLAHARAGRKPADLADALSKAARICADGRALGRSRRIVIKKDGEGEYPIDINRTVLEELLLFTFDILSIEGTKVQVCREGSQVVAGFEYHPRFDRDLLRVATSRIKSLGGEIAVSKNGESMFMSISFTGKDIQDGKKA